MNIQQVLTQLKEKLGSDAAIGEAIDAPQPTVNRLRNGKHADTSSKRAERIRQLAKQYNIDV